MEDINKSMILRSTPIEIAEDSGDSTCKYATFLISVLDEYDRLDRMIPSDAAEKYHATLRGFPVVAKLLKDRISRPIDFGGHEMREYKTRKGDKKTEFGTYPIGSIIDTWIEDREVAGYEGVKRCMMAKAKLWTCRSPEYFTVLDKLWAENRVSSSWELAALKVEKTSAGKKILRVFSFIGNAILGSTSVPAVKGAGVYEYAELKEEDEDSCQEPDELSEALSKDINNNKEEQEESSLTEEEKKLEEETLKEKEKQEEVAPVEPAACGGGDNKDEKKKDEKAEVAEEEPVKDEPVIPAEDTNTDGNGLAEKVTQLGDALIEANKIIQQLQGEIESLIPLKEQAEKAEAERLAAEKEAQTAELKEYAIQSRQITEAELTENESIKTMVANLDKAGIQAIITDRLVSSFSSGNVAKNLVASVTRPIVAPRADISDGSDCLGGSIVSAYINRNKK